MSTFHRRRLVRLVACFGLVAAGTAGVAAGTALGATSAAPIADDGARVVSSQVVDARMVDLQVSSPALGFTAPVRLILPRDWTAAPNQTWGSTPIGRSSASISLPSSSLAA